MNLTEKLLQRKLNKTEEILMDKQEPNPVINEPFTISATDPLATPDPSPVDHPDHYTSHPSGVEAIEITEYMSFCLGNAMKYIWRAGQKNDQIEDLEKAIWYINREIDRLSR